MFPYPVRGVAWVSLGTHHVAERISSKEGEWQKETLSILGGKEASEQKGVGIHRSGSMKFTDLSKRNPCTFFIFSDVSCPLKGVHKSFKVFLHLRGQPFLKQVPVVLKLLFPFSEFFSSCPRYLVCLFSISWILQNSASGSSSYVSLTAKPPNGICVFEKPVSYGKLRGCELPSSPMRNSKSSCFIN